MRRYLIATLPIALLLLAGCGGDSAGPRQAPGTATASTPAPAATVDDEVPSTTTSAPTPTAHDRAVAQAICAEPFYAQAFSSVSECEATMADPKAVAELKGSIESYGGRTTP